jgi:hypothetical protein
MCDMDSFDLALLDEDVAEFKKEVFNTYYFICKCVRGIRYKQLLEILATKMESKGEPKGEAELVVEFLLYHGFIYIDKDNWVKKT